MLQLSSVAGGQYASVVMAAKPSGKFDTSIANLWTHCVSHDRNAERVYRVARCHRLKKKKEKLLSSKNITNNILVDRLSLFLSLSLFTILVRTRAPKGCTLSKRGKLFPLSRKKILRTAPENRTGIPEIPQSTTRYLTQEMSNLKTDAPTIRHTAQTV